MTTSTVPREHDALRALLEQEGIERVAIIDDALDALSNAGLQPDEEIEIWGRLEFDRDARGEIAALGFEVNRADDLTGELIDKVLRDSSNSRAFLTIWESSTAERRIADALQDVNIISDHLGQALGLQVKIFASDDEISELVEQDPQLIFLDWYLGNERVPSVEDAISKDKLPDPVEAAVAKVQEIFGSWPSDKSVPLIILMSSRTGVEDAASQFCLSSGILRGMFYAVEKKALTDSFALRVHMDLFARSLTPGRRFQNMVDGFRDGFKHAEQKFFDGIRDLTLNDYAYIQSLGLQKDGQPLGSYLLSLFSDHMGQLLFSDALRDVCADFDETTFDESLPSLGPPSGTLTEIYQSSLLDTSVGPLPNDDDDELPALVLGDLLKRQASPGSDGTDPDLLLIINAQCDLELRPDPKDRIASSRQSVLLLPGFLRSIGSLKPDDPKTEFYQDSDGTIHSIQWDIKRIKAVALGEFNRWIKAEGFQREARLRLPLALDLQRAFTSDLTRVGSPVMAPIYQPVHASLLRPANCDPSTYERLGVLEEADVFLILTRSGRKGVLTVPLVLRLKEAMDEHIEGLEAQCNDLREKSEDVGYLPQKINSLKNAISDDGEWSALRKPFDLPNGNNTHKFVNGRVQIAVGANPGDRCDGTVIIAVSIDPPPNAYSQARP